MNLFARVVVYDGDCMYLAYDHLTTSVFSEPVLTVCETVRSQR